MVDNAKAIRSAMRVVRSAHAGGGAAKEEQAKRARERALVEKHLREYAEQPQPVARRPLRSAPLLPPVSREEALPLPPPAPPRPPEQRQQPQQPQRQQPVREPYRTPQATNEALPLPPGPPAQAQAPLAPGSYAMNIPHTGDEAQTQAILSTIRARESRNNYSALNRPKPGEKPSTASGAYQFVDPTWRSVAPGVGVDVTRYPTAMSAPAQIQDAVAAHHLQNILRRSNNDISLVPVAWQTGNIHGRSNSVSPDEVQDYQRKWLTEFQNQFSRPRERPPASSTPPLVPPLTNAPLEGGMVEGPPGAAAGGAITAYHASPHDIDEFDLSKVNEGTKTRGHGIYFDERPGFADAMREGMGGHIYETDLHLDPQRTLHYNAGYHAQPMPVRAALQKAMSRFHLAKVYTGNLGGDHLVPKTPEQAQAYRDAGIQAVKYANPGAKGRGQTHGYVLLDDKAAKIKRKYAAGGFEPPHMRQRPQIMADIRSVGSIPGRAADVSKAMTMRARQTPPEEVFRQTGVFAPVEPPPGSFSPPHYYLRAEIPDTAADLTTKARAIIAAKAHGTKSKLGDVLEHPELYQAYPHLANTDVHFEDLKPHFGGYYQPPVGTLSAKNLGKIALNSNRDPDRLRRVALHEAQHLIQELHGFPIGSSLAAVESDPTLRAEAEKRKQDILDKELTPYSFVGFLAHLIHLGNPENVNLSQAELHKLHQEYLFEHEYERKRPDTVSPMVDAATKIANFRTYQNVPGERESRAVEHRSEIYPSDLRSIHPKENYFYDSETEKNQNQGLGDQNLKFMKDFLSRSAADHSTHHATIRWRAQQAANGAPYRSAGGAVDDALNVVREHRARGGASSPDDDVYRRYMEQILNPSSELQYEQAKKIAEGYKVGDLDYSGFKSHPILPSKITTSLESIPGVEPKEATPLTWDQFHHIGKGGTLFSLGGDRSNLGRLTHINGNSLAWPVDLHAGTKYQTEPNPGVVWANDKGAASALRNNIIRASKNGPVYGAFAPMGPQAVDSSKNMFDVLMSQIANSKISKKAAKKFDELLRSGTHVYRTAPGNVSAKIGKATKAIEVMKDWPGILTAEKARDFGFSKMSGSERASLVKLMDAAMWLKEGFPSISTTRAAITDPDLLHVSGNLIGGHVVELNPSKVDPKNLSFIHSTYGTPTAGKLIGKLPFVERQAALPDFAQSKLTDPKYISKKTGKPLLISPYSPNAGGRAAFRGDTELRQGIQPINNRMLESIQQDAEQKAKYGFKKGGNVVDDALRIASQYKPRGRP